MATFGGFPQTVNYQTVNVSSGGGSENLLINPRGKINQANESDGVLEPYQYFCDGWKAGALGAEVYIDSDGFRLISGSIFQMVPLDIDSGRVLRGNMDVLSGVPEIVLDNGGDTLTYAGRGEVNFEVRGDNCKFTRCILAESVNLPIYQQAADELLACLRFLQVLESLSHFYNGVSPSAHWASVTLSTPMHCPPAITRSGNGSVTDSTAQTNISRITQSGFFMSKNGESSSHSLGGAYLLDARL